LFASSDPDQTCAQRLAQAFAMKQALKQDALLLLLNWELAAYEECAGCRFTALTPMRGDEGGDGNWADARLEADHPLDLAERFIARQVVSETRRVFDVA
jgi:hypothetical protein